MARTVGKVFISYSHRDSAFLDRLQEHLAPHVRDGAIPLWVDTQIKPGDDWHEKIKAALADARVAILLVSVSFLASTFVSEEELPKLLAAAKERGLVILPVVVTPCLFRRTKLSTFQAINEPSKPLSGLSQYEQDLIWERVVESVLDALDAPPAEENRKQQDQVETLNALRLLERADVHYEAKRYQEALDAYEHVIHLLPNDARGYKGKGDTLWWLQLDETALAAYQQAIRLDPGFGRAYYGMGLALYQLNRLEEALTAFERSAELEPSFLHAYIIKGNILLRLSRLHEALAAYEYVVEHDPTNNNVRESRAALRKALQAQERK